MRGFMVEIVEAAPRHLVSGRLLKKPLTHLQLFNKNLTLFSYIYKLVGEGR
jgi:hypothetical protein